MNRHHFLIGLLLANLLWLSSCRDQELDMTVLTKTIFDTVAFTEIEANDGWKVTVVQDDQRTGVDLEYSAFLEDYLRVAGNGTQLSLGFSQRLNLPAGTVNNATVHVASLEKIGLDDAATMTLQGSFSGARLTLEIHDAATLRGGHFQGDLNLDLDDASTVVDFSVEGALCELVLNDASVFKGSLTATDLLSITANDASRVTTYGGESPQANIQVNGASFVNVVMTPAVTMSLQVSGASEASVNVSHQLEGSARDASKVFYQGNPVVQMDIDTSSSIHPL